MDVLSQTSTRLNSRLPHFSISPSPPSLSCSPSHLRRPSLQLHFTNPSAVRLRRCLAATPGPPPSEPPPQTDPIERAGFSRLQDRIQIFLAVLFWMSLFFWASAFDKRNNGRRSKGPRFRR